MIERKGPEVLGLIASALLLIAGTCGSNATGCSTVRQVDLRSIGGGDCFAGTCFRLDEFHCNVCMNELLPEGEPFECANYDDGEQIFCFERNCEDGECPCSAIYNTTENAIYRPCPCGVNQQGCKKNFSILSNVDCVELDVCDGCEIEPQGLVCESVGENTWTCPNYQLNGAACQIFGT